MRRNTKFGNVFKETDTVQPFLPKFFTFAFSEDMICVCIPPHRRGAYASSRYVEAGCDGRASDGRRPACARTAKSCGPGVPVLTPCATRSRVVAERGQESR